MILCKAQHAQKIDKMVLPGIQGGPLMHIIAAKAVCLKESLDQDFRHYQQTDPEQCRDSRYALARQGFDWSREEPTSSDCS